MVTVSMKKLREISILTFVLFNSYSCGGSSSNNETINRDIEGLLTITQGIYGQATRYDDVGDNPIEYNVGFRFEIFSEIPSSDPNDGIVPVASVETGEKGFYELELETGPYCLCTTFRRCLSINIVENKLLRLDYEFSSGPGWSFDVSEENIKSECN